MCKKKNEMGAFLLDYEFLVLIYESLHRTILPFKIIVGLVSKVKLVIRV